MLTIVNWSGNWFARVQRSTFTSGRIPSHAIPILWIGNQKFVYRRRCRPTRVVNTTRRRSASFITPMTVERVVAECIKFITYWSLWRKICGFNRQKLVAIATSLERSLPIFTTVIYARKATNPQSWGEIGRENFEEIWLENSKNQKHFRQFGSRSLKMVPFDRSHTTSIRLFPNAYAVSEIWRVDYNENLLPWHRLLRDRKNYFRIVHLQPP